MLEKSFKLMGASGKPAPALQCLPGACRSSPAGREQRHSWRRAPVPKAAALLGQNGHGLGFAPDPGTLRAWQQPPQVPCPGLPLAMELELRWGCLSVPQSCQVPKEQPWLLGALWPPSGPSAECFQLFAPTELGRAVKGAAAQFSSCVHWFEHELCAVEWRAAEPGNAPCGGTMPWSTAASGAGVIVCCGELLVRG